MNEEEEGAWGNHSNVTRKRINTVKKILSISDCGELILSMPQRVVRTSYPIFVSFLKKMTIDHI